MAAVWQPEHRHDVVAAEPCPAELELELALGGRPLFVSDLHLSGGGPTSDFAAIDPLIEVVDSLTGHPGPVILVLGGDILDLLQAQAPTRAGTPGPNGSAPGAAVPTRAAASGP